MFAPWTSVRPYVGMSPRLARLARLVYQADHFSDQTPPEEPLTLVWDESQHHQLHSVVEAQHCTGRSLSADFSNLVLILLHLLA